MIGEKVRERDSEKKTEKGTDIKREWEEKRK